jgi:short-subunit dehydrogenase
MIQDELKEQKEPEKPGTPRKTALITGASSGIGASYARFLAARGYYVILVARREEKLLALAEHIHTKHQAEHDSNEHDGNEHDDNMIAEILVADLSRHEEIARVEHRLSNDDTIEMLINNAGFGVGGGFVESDLDKQEAMVTVHVNATVRLCYAALPGMIKRGRGSIINVASVAAFFSAPGNVIYGSTKRFLIGFSESLQMELADTPIRIQALCPGFTYTEFHDTPEYATTFDRSKIPETLWMTADEVVEGSLDQLGRSHPRVVYIPGWRNRVLTFLAQNSVVMAIRRSRLFRPLFDVFHVLKRDKR